MSNKKLLLIDGSGFIFRAYHSLPPLTRRDGTPVGAVYGFVNMLSKLLEQMPATHIGVIFDAARKTFRNDLYEDYKAHRPPAPDDLVPQFALVREATEAMNLPAIELPNFEADDIIATYARLASEQQMDTVIISSDKDLMQLINDHVKMYDAMKNKVIDAEQVLDKFGVTPDKVIEVQALIGDSSDNVPGVPGIGVKGAAQLIKDYGSLEGLLSRTEEIKQPKRRQSLIDNADLARISKELVTLKVDCEGLPSLESLTIIDSDADKILSFLKAQNFTSLFHRTAEKLGVNASDFTGNGDSNAESTAEEAVQVTTDYQLVTDIETLKDWLQSAKSVGKIAFDVETTGLDATQAELVGFSLCIEAGKACYVPLNHKEMQEIKAKHKTQADLFGAADDAGNAEQKPVRLQNQLTTDEALAILKPFLEDASILKIGQNIKYDALVMKQLNVDISPIEDTMLLSYCLSAGARKHNMNDLAKAELDISPVPFSEVAGKGKAAITFDFVPLDKALGYASEDADITLRLWQKLKPRLMEEHLVTIYERMERPLVPVVVRMENHGVKADAYNLKNLSDNFASEMERLVKQIHLAAGKEFNVASPKQVGEVLFEHMGIEGGKKSAKTGAYATGAEVLEEIAMTHPIAADLLEWRQLSKLKSTYSDALPKQINPKTKRIHTSYSLAATSTGRLSSSDPNLQNIPVRTKAGRQIREAFIAEDGFKLFSADYSQIELRLLAHMAEIEPLLQAFKDGRDIHATTASQMFGVPIDEVTDELRRKAKTINFGIIYGISAHGLAVRLAIGRKEAKTYIESYFEQYPGIQKYMEATKDIAKEQGYVETLYGRRCYIAGINDKNGARRAFAERAAINAPLQGSAADIIKRAMIAVDDMLRNKEADTRMLLQVHDELIFEIPPHEEEWVTEAIIKTMEQAAHLSIPLVVDSGIGRHWGGIH